MTEREPSMADAGFAEVADLAAEARDRVAGRIRYAIDTALPSMAWAALVRSPVPAGRLRGIDVRVASAADGVLAIVSGEDLAREGLAGARFGGLADQPILATDRVSYVGEPVAVVVAEGLSAATSAAAQVRVDVDASVPVFEPDAALRPDSPVVREGRADNVLSRWTRRNGDLPAARSRAARTFRDRFSSPAAQQASLEPHVCLASWGDGRLRVWSTSQNPSRVAAELASLFGLEASAVEVRVPPLGGAYGGKNQAKLEPLVAFASRMTGRPVKLVNRRADEFVTVTKHPAVVTIESGVDEDGRFTHRSAEILWNAGAYALSSVPVARAGGLAVLGPYRIPAAAVESVMVYTNHPPGGSFRGLGVSQAAWAGEQQVDRIAQALGVDPVEFRRANLLASGERLWTGEPVADAHWLECLDAAVEQLDEARRRDRGVRPASAHETLRRATGVAVAMKHTITPARSEAILALRGDGRVEVRTSAVDMGQGVEVVLARVAADALQLPLERMIVVRPDTSRTPFDMTTSSSRATFAVGNAVEAAAVDLLDRVAEAVSVSLGVPPDRLDRDGDRFVDRDGGRGIAPAAVAAAAPGGEILGRGTFVNEPERDVDTGEPVSSSHWHQGAVAVDVAVDVGTGVVRVERAAGAAWAGKVVNPPGARLQNEGNVIFGLGPSLFETLEFPTGAPAVSDLLDYRLPTIADVPVELATRALEGPPKADEPTERHGLGESLIPAVAPAIGNAVAAAVGGRVRDLPISPERVLAALDAGAVGDARDRSDGP